MKDYKEIAKEIDFRTWQLKVILDNTRETYFYLVNNGEELITLSDDELLNEIKSITPREHRDGVKWCFVDCDQIRDNIRDLFEEAKA